MHDDLNRWDHLTPGALPDPDERRLGVFVIVGVTAALAALAVAAVIGGVM